MDTPTFVRIYSVYTCGFVATWGTCAFVNTCEIINKTNASQSQKKMVGRARFNKINIYIY